MCVRAGYGAPCVRPMSSRRVDSRRMHSKRDLIFIGTRASPPKIESIEGMEIDTTANDYGDGQWEDQSPSMRMCPYCLSTDKSHPRFVYIASNLGCKSFDCADTGHTVNCKASDEQAPPIVSNHIGISCNPADRVRELNRVAGTHCNHKPTNKHKPRWRLELQIGGFVDDSSHAEEGATGDEQAVAAKQEWRLKRRTLEYRVVGGYDLYKKENARRSHVHIFARDVTWVSNVIQKHTIDQSKRKTEKKKKKKKQKKSEEATEEGVTKICDKKRIR